MKMFLQKFMFQIGLKKVFFITEAKNTVSWTFSVNDLKAEEFVGTFYEKELQKANEKEFRVVKVIKIKYNKRMLNRKATIVLLTFG